MLINLILKGLVLRHIFYKIILKLNFKNSLLNIFINRNNYLLFNNLIRFTEPIIIHHLFLFRFTNSWSKLK